MASGVRMTFNAKSTQIMYNLEKSYAKMMDYQEQLSTGKKVQRPSDNPISTTNILKTHTKESMNEQFKRNLADGKAYLYAYDSILQDSVNSLQRGRELSVQARTDTLSDKERNSIAVEVVQLTRGLMAKANTLYKGDYIFNGTQTDKAPYNLRIEEGETLTSGVAGVAIQMGSTLNPQTATVIPTTLNVSDGSGNDFEEGVDYEVDYVEGTITPLAGGALTDGTDFEVSYESIEKSLYTNNEDINRQISESSIVTINMHASDAFETNTGTDVFETFIAFAEGLVENDETIIEDSITKIDDMMDNMLRVTSSNGAKINIFEDQDFTLKDEDVEIATILGEYEDIDYGEVISSFTMQQNLFQSSMQAAGKILTPFLGNYI